MKYVGVQTQRFQSQEKRVTWEKRMIRRLASQRSTADDLALLGLPPRVVVEKSNQEPVRMSCLPLLFRDPAPQGLQFCLTRQAQLFLWALAQWVQKTQRVRRIRVLLVLSVQQAPCFQRSRVR